jgi:hypothetical protein
MVERPGWLFPTLGSAAAAVFLAFVWLAGARPAFVDVARPIAELPARGLGAELPPGWMADQPAVVLVWMPG